MVYFDLKCPLSIGILEKNVFLGDFAMNFNRMSSLFALVMILLLVGLAHSAEPEQQVAVTIDTAQTALTDSSAENGVKWIKHDLPQQAAGHGIGAGDINSDGRCDVVASNGWLEQTAKSGWTWHQEFSLGSASIPILVHDVDGDSDSDIIWGLGHDYGIFWLEQGKDEDGKRKWQKHKIDDSWSQPHFMLFADLDNDGKNELITGKRVHAHNGNDPGGNDPPCVYYYSFDAPSKKWKRHLLHEGGKVGFGINTQAKDIDGDGDIDIVAPGKSGLYLIENLLVQQDI